MVPPRFEAKNFAMMSEMMRKAAAKLADANGI
jgi:hypothetical protein